MMCIVLDKSFLQGSNAADIRRLTSTYQVLMIETLFYELATASDAEFRTLLSKISEANAVKLLPRPGALFRYEIANQEPALPVLSHVLPGSFRLNPQFRLGPDELETMRDWRIQVEKEIADYPETARGIENWFPGLRELSEDERRKKCQELKKAMSNDDVLAVYRDIAGDVFDEFPSHAMLDENWILYRWTQSRIIGALDLVSTYGFEAEPSTKKLENHIHDLEYLTIAGQVGAIATRDKPLTENFRMIRPDGFVLA